MSATNKAWTPEQLANHIKEICGTAIADKLAPLQERVTKYGDWLTNAGVDRLRAQPVPMEKGLAFAGVLAALASAGGSKDKNLALT